VTHRETLNYRISRHSMNYVTPLWGFESAQFEVHTTNPTPKDIGGRSPQGEGECRKLLVLLLTHHEAPGVRESKRIMAGLAVVCVVLLWAISPVFIESADYVLTLTANPSTNTDCPIGSACFTLELQNRGPWPVTIDIVELQVYPSLIGPSVNVNWVGPGPDRLVLIPFTGHSYTFWIKIMGGLNPPDRVYVILTANVTLLYASHHVVLHSGKRLHGDAGFMLLSPFEPYRISEPNRNCQECASEATQCVCPSIGGGTQRQHLPHK